MAKFFLLSYRLQQRFAEQILKLAQTRLAGHQMKCFWKYTFVIYHFLFKLKIWLSLGWERSKVMIESLITDYMIVFCIIVDRFKIIG